MKQVNLYLALVLVLASFASAQTEKPNILVIMTDDLGWSNLGSYHQGLMNGKTPNIDRLAAEGMRFTDYYAQPSCTAGRAAFITGQFPVRVGLHTVGLPGDPVGIEQETPTIAKILRDEFGYATGEFGKNHLGDQDEFLPTQFGFEEYWGWLYHLNAMEYTFDPDWPDDEEQIQKYAPRNIVHSFWKNGKHVVREDPAPLYPERMETLEDEITEKTTDFISQAVEDDRPFFVWHNTSRVHVWTYLREKYRNMMGYKTGWGLHEAAMKELDDHVGELLGFLEAVPTANGSRNVADNTIVIFTSDNGPEIMSWPDAGTTPFRGEKGTTWEGGFRVPMLIRWPGKVPAGTVNNELFDSMDWMPTLVAAVGGPEDLPQELKSPQGYGGYRAHLDGFNQLATLADPNAASTRKSVIFYEGTTLQAVRYGDWKAHFVVQNEGWFGAKEELNGALIFNLRRDPYERAAEESLTYLSWLGKKMWVVGPIQGVVEEHLKTFVRWPPPGEDHKANFERLRKLIMKDHPFTQ